MKTKTKRYWLCINYVFLMHLCTDPRKFVQLKSAIDESSMLLQKISILFKTAHSELDRCDHQLRKERDSQHQQLKSKVYS
jgi:hypothetical protein